VAATQSNFLGANRAPNSDAVWAMVCCRFVLFAECCVVLGVRRTQRIDSELMDVGGHRWELASGICGVLAWPRVESKERGNNQRS